MPNPKAQKHPIVVMRTYHSYKQRKKRFSVRGARKRQVYTHSEVSEVVHPPHPNAKFEVAEWFDEIFPTDDGNYGTVRVLWKIDLEEGDDGSNI